MGIACGVGKGLVVAAAARETIEERERLGRRIGVVRFGILVWILIGVVVRACIAVD